MIILQWLLIVVWTLFTSGLSLLWTGFKSNLCLTYGFWEPAFLIVTFIDASGYWMVVCLICFYLNLVLRIEHSLYARLVNMIYSLGIFSSFVTTAFLVYLHRREFFSFFDNPHLGNAHACLIHLIMHAFVLSQAMKGGLVQPLWKLSVNPRIISEKSQ